MPSTTTPEAAAVRVELEARWPQLDWDVVLSDLSRTSPPEAVADWLISVGCDEDAVKALCFGS